MARAEGKFELKQWYGTRLQAPSQVVCECGRSVLIGIGTPIGKKISEAETSGESTFAYRCECGRISFTVSFRKDKEGADEKLGDGTR